MVRTLWSAKLRALISKPLGFLGLLDIQMIERLLPELQFPPQIRTPDTRFYSWLDWGAPPADTGRELWGPAQWATP